MKLNLTILALLCCCQVIGQQKYIEVTVSDTVMVKPDVFIYRIVSAPWDEALSYVTPRKGRESGGINYALLQSNGIHRFDSLKTALKAHGFAVLPQALADSVNFTNESAMRNLSCKVITHSVDSLGMLYRMLADHAGLSCMLESAVAADDSVYQKKLFGKTFAKAHAKAEGLAVYSRQQVRDVLSVTESKAEESAIYGWTSYPPLSSLSSDYISGWHTTIRSSFQTAILDTEHLGWYPLILVLTVRFSAE